MSVVLRLDHGGGRVSLPLKRRAHVRDRIAAEIERLVDMLDEIDGDPDAEPELGWPEGENSNGWKCAAGQIRHGDEIRSVQIRNGCAFSSADDREDDAGDDREPDEDREPILGWTAAVDQESPDRFGEAWQHDEAEESEQPLGMRPHLPWRPRDRTP